MEGESMSHPNWQTGLPCNCGFDKCFASRQAPRIASWEPGTWGKGLYYPETDHLVTWGDADGRMHLERQMDDEEFQPGAAHHLIIRPNGAVSNQGVFHRADLEHEPEGDVEGLSRALRAFDPHLRLDTSGWEFDQAQSPTEPVPTSPESEDEGRHHNVQISEDYLGGT